MSKLVIAIMILLIFKYNNIDLLYEIKYWNNPVSKATLARLVNQIEKQGIHTKILLTEIFVLLS